RPDSGKRPARRSLAGTAPRVHAPADRSDPQLESCRRTGRMTRPRPETPMNRLFYHPALPALEERLAKDLELLGLPEAPWMPQRTVEGHPVLDVAIIGGGMAGLTAAAALKLIGITNTGVFDAAPAGAEGPWATHARMQTLRSPKELAGPALGIPSLTFRAWYTDLHGEQAWQALDRIPRLVWHAYLLWYRQALDLPVHNRHRLTHISQVDAPELGGALARLEFSAAESGSENVVVH